jgi:hypothetical protein
MQQVSAVVFTRLLAEAEAEQHRNLKGLPAVSEPCAAPSPLNDCLW